LDLLADDEPMVRIFATYVLGRCQGRAAQVVPELVTRVPSEGDARSQAALVLALGSLATAVDERAAIDHVLAERMGPKECPVVRLAAAMGLARSYRIGPAAEVLDTLLVSAGSAWSDFEDLPWCEGGSVAISVGEALAEYPEARLRFVLGLLDSRDEEVRRDARFAVDALCHERRSITLLAASALGERVLAGDPADRRGTVEILSHLGSAAALAAGPLGAALDDDDPQIRAHAAIALAILRDHRAIPVLIPLLNDDHFFPKVAEALGRFGAAAKDAVPALLDVLRRKSPYEEILAHNRPIEVSLALGQIGPEARPAVPALLALMKKYPHTCLAVTLALGQIGGPEGGAAVSLLTKLLRSQDEPVRIRAAQTLWRIDRRADQVLPVLIESLQPGGKNRSQAAEVLGEIGTAARDAVPALRACLEDRSFHSRWVKLQAARAIWRIDRSTEGSLPVFIGLLGDPGQVGALVATQAAEALGEMGAVAMEAIPVLRAALAEDVRPFGGIVDEIVIRDEAFCSTVAEALRRIVAVHGSDMTNVQHGTAR
jgi:HEAT repeat protein